MIVFSGEVNKAVLKRATRWQSMLETLFAFIAEIILGSFIVPLLFQVSFAAGLIVIIGFAVVLLMIFFARQNAAVKKYNLAKSIHITPERIVASIEGAVPGDPDDYNAVVFGLDKVESVTDYGAFYDIKADMWPIHFYCQKDLLTQGTLEDFEKLFADKLVRKVKKNNK